MESGWKIVHSSWNEDLIGLEARGPHSLLSVICAASPVAALFFFGSGRVVHAEGKFAIRIEPQHVQKPCGLFGREKPFSTFLLFRFLLAGLRVFGGLVRVLFIFLFAL